MCMVVASHRLKHIAALVRMKMNIDGMNGILEGAGGYVGRVQIVQTWFVRNEKREGVGQQNKG